MSAQARDFQVLLISGYARRIIKRDIIYPVIKECIMFYNGFGFHVEIPPFSFAMNEEQLELKCHPLSWSNCDSTTFDVRRGPNYVDGQKSKSKPSIYTIFKLEGYRLPFKMHKIWNYLHSNFDEAFKREISKYSVPNNQNNPYRIPPLLIINILIPNYKPDAMGKNKNKCDGDGYCKILYCHLSDATYKKLNKFTNNKSSKKLPISPSIKLLSNFMKNNDKKITNPRDRFKVIPRVMNGKYSKFGFVANKLIRKYNAKPFLCRTSTKYYLEPGKYFGIDIDVHSFSFAAKKGLSLVKDTIATAIYDVAFVIEGKQNHELPEQILCAARISKLGLNDLCKDITNDIKKKYLNNHNYHKK